MSYGNGYSVNRSCTSMQAMHAMELRELKELLARKEQARKAKFRAYTRAKGETMNIKGVHIVLCEDCASLKRIFEECEWIPDEKLTACERGAIGITGTTINN